MTGPVTFLARGLLAGVFISGGISQVKGARLLAPKVDAAKEEYGIVTEVAGEDLVRLNGAGMVLAGGALALGVAPRLSAAVLVSMLIPTTVVGHPFWKLEDEAKRRAAVSGMFNNAAVIGGLLLVAAGRRR